MTQAEALVNDQMMQHLDDWQTQHQTRPHVSAESLKTVSLLFYRIFMFIPVFYSDMETGSLISVKLNQLVDQKSKQLTEQEMSLSNSNSMICLRT